MDSLGDVVYFVVVKSIDIYLLVKAFFVAFLPKMVKTVVDTIFDDHDLPIGGKDPWNIQVKDDKFYLKVAVSSMEGFLEAYTDGWWDCDDLEEFMYRANDSGLLAYGEKVFDIRIMTYFKLHAFGTETKIRRKEIEEKHYDFGQDFFEVVLGGQMNYSCGYWKSAQNLNEAQVAKMKLAAEKLKLQPGMRILEIGCGWGALCKYLAEKYQVQVVGYTKSKEQADYARKLCEGLEVEIRLEDYRKANDKYDRVVSIEFLEQIGESNYGSFFQVAQRCLTDDGLLLVQTAGVNQSEHPRSDLYVHDFVLDTRTLPSAINITKYTEGYFILEDWHNFGADYAKTLLAWSANLEKGMAQLREKYNEKMLRLWSFYFLTGGAMYRARTFQLWQIVMSPQGLAQGYESVR